MSTPPTAPKTEDLLQWKPRKMVVWLDPWQLVGTGLRSVISTVFGAYADKREVQAALTPLREEPQAYSLFHDRDEIWIDYTADLGDGFDSTYTIARLLAEPHLTPEGATDLLTRGDILVLGGDQVYPTARRDEYNVRFEQPYRFALPWVPDERAPSLFAIPGNHDWYDGLTSFTRLFCQNRWIGGWKTRQTRSYFALRLPHNWWLWGIDIQLEADIDLPQLEYFRRIAESAAFKGARVILCTGTPSWTEMIKDNTPEKRAAYRNLGHFENRVINRNGGQVEVTLTGDMHHYCRYACAAPGLTGAPAQKITAGGGGAYLYGTHGMPEQLELDSAQDDLPPVPYDLQTVYPPKTTSRNLANVGILLFPFRNWRFALLLGCFYALNAWIVQGASGDESLSLFGSLATLSLHPRNIWTALEEVLHVLVHSPISFALSCAFTGALYAFADANTRLGRVGMGISHGAVHLLLNFALCWVLSRGGFLLSGVIAFEPEATGTADPFNASLQVIAVLLVILLTSTFAGGWLFGLYLYLAERWGHRHMEEVFSSQRIPHYKNFLRLHIDREGTLRIFPIGVDTVGTKWVYQPGATNGRAFFEDAAGPIADRAHLIEKPIVFPAPPKA